MAAAAVKLSSAPGPAARPAGSRQPPPPLLCCCPHGQGTLLPACAVYCPTEEAREWRGGAAGLVYPARHMWTSLWQWTVMSFTRLVLTSGADRVSRLPLTKSSNFKKINHKFNFQNFIFTLINNKSKEKCEPSLFSCGIMNLFV